MKLSEVEVSLKLKVKVEEDCAGLKDDHHGTVLIRQGKNGMKKAEGKNGMREKGTKCTNGCGERIDIEG